MILTRKKWLEEKINMIQSAIWWNELILKIQEEAGDSADKLDATKTIITKDQGTLTVLKNELKNCK